MNRLRTHTPFYLTRPAQVVYIIAAAVVAALLSGCAPNTSDDQRMAMNPSVYRDRVTGCEYLARASGESGLTPRMGRDGKQVCADAALVGAK